MNVPSKTQKQWADIVTGRKAYELKFLAAKILLGRMIHSLGPEPSTEAIKEAIDQLHFIYSKNESSPSAQADLHTIFG
ncbi:MAG: hypothetical protein GX055_12095 [Desulfovibrionales bacterium]|nr:hypothetical protein [Desulfovibrionales bacterium]